MHIASDGSTKSIHVVEVTAIESPSTPNEIPAYLRDLAPRVTSFARYFIPDGNLILTGFRIFSSLAIAKPNLIISNEYRRSFFVNIALIILRRDAIHIVVGMNLSAKPIKTNIRLADNLIDKIFRRCTKIVVHSRYEAFLFCELHNIPIDRFAFSHWGYDLPQLAGDRFSGPRAPYVCMVGRNNRDLETFAKAVELAGIHGVAIVPAYASFDPMLERRLEIHRDLPLAECIDCIRNSKINLTLLRDDQRGAGHITVVTALHLGVPQIHSDAQVLKEYVPFAFLSAPVPIGDAQGVASKILAILKGEPPGTQAKRKEFAERWLSHASAMRRLGAIVLASVDHKELSLTDPEWDQWLDDERRQS
jgi:hypothetical protein